MIDREKIAIFTTLFCFSGEISAQITPDTLYDNFGITKMVTEANANDLQQLSKAQTSEHLAAKAGYYRVNLDLNKSNIAANECITDPALQQGTGLATLYLCYTIRAGNELILGEISKWAQDMSSAKTIYVDHIMDGTPKESHLLNLNNVNFDRFKTWDAMYMPPNTGSFSIPIDSSHGIPLITAALTNGADGIKRNVSSDFIIDTGSSRSILSTDAAKAIGLKINEGFVYQSTGDNYSQTGLTDPIDLKIGPVTLRNISFSTSPFIHVNIIGVDLLYKLSPFMIDRKDIHFLTKIEAPCTNKILSGSSLDGTYFSIRYPLMIGDKRTLVRSDTGADIGFEASGIDLSKYPKTLIENSNVVTSMGIKSVNYVTGVIPVNLGNEEIKFSSHITDQPADAFPISWRLGFAIHNSYNLYFDLPKGIACLQ